MQKHDEPYVYLIVREDLPHPHLSVQASHAAYAVALAYGSPHQTHPNLVLCSVADEAALNDAFNALKDAGVKCCGWYEDDMGNALTAVAAGPVRGAGRKPMKRFKLLR